MATMMEFGRATMDRLKWRKISALAADSALATMTTTTTALADELPAQVYDNYVTYATASAESGTSAQINMAAAQMQNAYDLSLARQHAQMQQFNNAWNSPAFTITTSGTGWLSGDYATFTLGNELQTAALGGASGHRGKKVDEPSREMLKRVEVEVQDLDLTDPRQKLATEAEALLGYTPLRKELRTPGTLRRVLAKLEIAVLDEESVNQYKNQMVEHYRTHNKMLSPTWRVTRLREYTQPVPEFVLAKAVEIKRELPEAEFYIDQLAVDPFLIVSLAPVMDFMTNQKRNLDPETAAYVEVWAEAKFEAAL
jgi:hypothetical protein